MDPFVLGAFFQDFEVLDVSKLPIPPLSRRLFEDSERHKSGERGHYRVVGKAKAETADFLRYFSFWQISEIRNESRLRYFNFSRFFEIRNESRLRYFNFSRFSEIRIGNKKKGRNVGVAFLYRMAILQTSLPFLERRKA